MNSKIKNIYSFILLIIFAVIALTNPTQSLAKETNRVFFSENYYNNLFYPETETIKSLAKELTKNYKKDLAKAAAIYLWIGQNITFDINNDCGECSAEKILENKKGSAKGISNLYRALGKEAGLEILSVRGYSKGLMQKSNSSFDKPNHSWNRIQIAGEWRVFDVAQSNKNISNDSLLVATKAIDDYWFDVSPYQAIFDHFPTSLPPLLIVPSINLETFKQLPIIKKSYFQTGFSAKNTYRSIRKNLKVKFPKSYDIKTAVKILEAPAHKSIVVGKSSKFKFVIPAASKVAVLDENSEWHYLKEVKKGIWEGSYIPKAIGQLSVVVSTSDSSDSYNILMGYMIVEK